ncbi:MAG: tRNA (guanosine(37)-N1)-methyltransferase TrmD [Bulleidia sp.]
MRITILTVVPDMLESLWASPIIRHALAKGIITLEMIDIRSFADGSFRHIDDSPFGGGAGMIMRCEPVYRAYRSVYSEQCHTVIPMPAGHVYTQAKAHELCGYEHLILIAGHYEGLDERIVRLADECICMGDYIMSGGEYACMNIVDSIVRLLPGVIRKESTEDESFENGLLEYGQYTKPVEFEGMRVPDVLRSGNHQKIAAFRRQDSLLKTMRYRPELLEHVSLSEEEKRFLEQESRESVQE